MLRALVIISASSSIMRFSCLRGAASAGHQSVKKAGVQPVIPVGGGGTPQLLEGTALPPPGLPQHPNSSDGGDDPSGGDEEDSVIGGGGGVEAGTWVVSGIIAAVLVVPVLALVAITLCMRARRKGQRPSLNWRRGQYL